MKNEDYAAIEELSKEEALRAYARMMHHFSFDYLEPLLDDDFHYTSAWVVEEITSKQQYLDYMRPKLVVIRRSGDRVWADMSWLPDSRGSYLVMAQGDQEKIVGTVWAHVEGDKIERIDMRQADCIDTLGRSGEYPT
jgi:hypothetical protein